MENLCLTFQVMNKLTILILLVFSLLLYSKVFLEVLNAQFPLISQAISFQNEKLFLFFLYLPESEKKISKRNVKSLICPSNMITTLADSAIGWPGCFPFNDGQSELLFHLFLRCNLSCMNTTQITVAYSISRIACTKTTRISYFSHGFLCL